MQYITAFTGLFLWRYLRLVVNIVASLLYKPFALPHTPSYTSLDVTVVISTLGDSDDFGRCLLSISACCPASIIIVVPKGRADRVRKICNVLGIPNVQILGAQMANKRLQMIQGLKEVRTCITFFADDDVLWGSSFLSYNLAHFEDPTVGAV
ncbi:MAG: hypothetical protein Q9200_002626, partial [Gallowayella weberi]